MSLNKLIHRRAKIDLFLSFVFSLSKNEHTTLSFKFLHVLPHSQDDGGGLSMPKLIQIDGPLIADQYFGLYVRSPKSILNIKSIFHI